MLPGTSSGHCRSVNYAGQGQYGALLIPDGQLEVPVRLIKPIPEKKKIAPSTPYTASILKSPVPLTNKTAAYINPPIPNKVNTRPNTFLISISLK